MATNGTQCLSSSNNSLTVVQMFINESRPPFTSTRLILPRMNSSFRNKNEFQPSINHIWKVYIWKVTEINEQGLTHMDTWTVVGLTMDGD